MILPYISKYDPYSGIEIDPIGISVDVGHYPFIEDQKFIREGKKFKVVEFVFSDARWVLYNQKIITDVVFETISNTPNRFKVEILQVLTSLKEGRTKFSL